MFLFHDDFCHAFCVLGFVIKYAKLYILYLTTKLYNSKGTIPLIHGKCGLAGYALSGVVFQVGFFAIVPVVVV